MSDNSAHNSDSAPGALSSSNTKATPVDPSRSNTSPDSQGWISTLLLRLQGHASQDKRSIEYPLDDLTLHPATSGTDVRARSPVRRLTNYYDDRYSSDSKEITVEDCLADVETLRSLLPSPSKEAEGRGDQDSKEKTRRAHLSLDGIERMLKKSPASELSRELAWHLVRVEWQNMSKANISLTALRASLFAIGVPSGRLEVFSVMSGLTAVSEAMRVYGSGVGGQHILSTAIGYAAGLTSKALNASNTYKESGEKQQLPQHELKKDS